MSRYIFDRMTNKSKTIRLEHSLKSATFASLVLLGLALPPVAFGGAVAALTTPGLDTMEHPELLPLFLPDGTETRQSA